MFTCVFMASECLYYSMVSNELGMMNDSGVISLTTRPLSTRLHPSICTENTNFRQTNKNNVFLFLDYSREKENSVRFTPTVPKYPNGSLGQYRLDFSSEENVSWESRESDPCLSPNTSGECQKVLHSPIEPSSRFHF